VSATSLVYWNDQWGKVQPRLLRLQYNITAAVTVAPIVSNSASLVTFSAIAAQTTIDNFLGTTNEFLIAAFDATSMGADAMGVIVNLAGQCRSVVMMEASCYSAAGGGTIVTRGVASLATLTASSLATEVACGASGNVALKVDWGNTPDFDALTSGVISIDIHWISK